jgi:ribose transport system ATP-binding protein
MDEPTAALTEHEIDSLFKAIRDIKKLGVTIIYISHRLEEIKKIADVVTVIRDGEVKQTCNVNKVDINEIIKVMAGKELEDRYPKLKVKLGKEHLRVEKLGYHGRINNISFDVKKGEILGITGLSGSGRRTLAKTLIGINSPYEGQIIINGKAFKNMTPDKAKRNGLCYVTGIGTDEGLIINAPITENITLANLKRILKGGFINRDIESKLSKDLMKRLEITAEENEIVNNLSGGKQKKVIFAKWLFSNAKVLIIDEPTAGIDIASKVDIYNIINELVLSGASIIMISSDLSEVMGMCDRILVMFNGEIRKIFNKGETTQEKILYFASGGKESIE